MGKSTLAELLHRAVPASTIVHTDDVAWHHSFLDWADLLAEEVLEPVRRGTGLELVLVEGVGAGRRELAHVLDAVVWVQWDFGAAERRGIARDIAQGVNGDAEESIAFWHEWMKEELAFIERQRPWERACVVVSGT